MKNGIIYGLFLVTIFGIGFLTGCATQTNSYNNEIETLAESDVMIDGYYGEILAGDNTLYLVFDQRDYDKAVSENKKIMLYFYADWCPSCKAEQVDVIAAFDELAVSDIIAFRVNYRDSNTDDFEEDLAREHGITYQHTKVFIVDGERTQKAPNIWSKDKYIEEVMKLQ